ncbi:hypothetical protein PMIN07_006092 [Paraphaeosphaeria minitans]
MDASRQFRKRPQSVINPTSRRAPIYEHRRIYSTGDTEEAGTSNKSHRKASTQGSTAFADFDFFDDEPRPSITGVSHSDAPLLGLPWEETSVNSQRADERGYGSLNGNKPPILRKATTLDTPPRPSFPAYIDTSKLIWEKLTHPSGSPVLKREFMLKDQEPTSLALSNKLEVENAITAKETDTARRSAETRARDQFKASKDILPGIRDHNLVVLEEPTVSVAKHVAGPGHIEEYHPKPKVVAIGKDKDVQDAQSRRHSANDHSDRRQEAHNAAQNFQIRRKSLPANTKPPVSPATTLEATREWLKSLADEESEKWSKDSVVHTSEGSEDIPSATEDSVSYPQSGSTRLEVSSRERPQSKAPQSDKTIAKKTATTTQSRNVRPGTPGPTSRPASPPLHRNVAENRKPLERQDRDSSTLYETSCWTEKSYLKTLLKGPVLQFRVEPHGEPFLNNVSKEMLEHFCGEKHVDRLIRDYSLRPEQRRDTDGEETVLVFPEGLVDATAIMRVARYMRRCCMRTTTLTKPYFQLHAPPSLEANIETIRACNMFGLYADARRLQYFLTVKKIPGGKLTMEDVETIWEGYNGGLRDSAYTDALLTHLVYNVLGSDSIDREEIMILLGQEEFAELRELISMELGIKKRAAESRDMFQMRKESERQDKANQKNGKGKQLSKLEKIRKSRGPMVQGRLLRVLSYDALLEPDLTAGIRYKTRPGLGRRSTLTPDLTDRSVEKELDSAGTLYQKALKEIKESGTAAERLETMLEGLSDVEEETAVALRFAPGRPTAPTVSPEERRVQDLEDMHGMIPRKIHEPSRTAMGGTRSSGDDNSSDINPFGNQGKVMSPRIAASAILDTQPKANIRPVDTQRTYVYATSRASTGLGINVGRIQPGSSIANVNHARSITTTVDPYALRSRTDPWWGTLGHSPPLAEKKSRSKLKQMWDEVRNFL